MSSPEVVDAGAPPHVDDDDDEDNEFTGKVGAVESDGEHSPRITVEEHGLDDEDDDDLFGDAGVEEDEEPPEAERKLDDEDLDSGDDEDRTDRVPGGTQDDVVEETYNYMDAEIARHAVPEPSDGELYLLKVPRFLSFEPTAFSHKTFQTPTTDHHSKVAASEHFSPFETAMSTIRWRRSPSNPAQLQSNARVVRWSDGSLTLQFASQPVDQYEINGNMLAPPQINPSKPTPTSLLQKPNTEYKESYTYLVAPYEEASVMRITNKLTTGLTVVPTATSKDGALEALQNALSKAATRTHDEKEGAISFIHVTEDPELERARKEAEFKEKQRRDRAREKNEMREREKASRRLGGGVRSSGYGLSIGGLEDEGGARKARKPKPKSGLRRDWSSDEDYGIQRGGARDDDYASDDGFIARSDEEPEIMDDDEDEDDGIIESPPRRGASPKRNRGGDDDDDDEEVVISRTKRRRVVDDDDEDE